MIAVSKLRYLLCCTKCARLSLQGVQELVDGVKQNCTLQKLDLESKVHMAILTPPMIRHSVQSNQCASHQLPAMECKPSCKSGME